MTGSYRSVAHIGALVIAVSWAIGPFSQQTIRTTQCLREDLERATIPVARSIPTDDLTQLIPGGDFYELGVVAKITALKGLVNPRGNDTAISVGCRSGECTFEELNGITHSTIGVCSKCIDTSLLVTEITAPVELNPTNATFSSNETTLPSNGPSNYPRYTLPPFQDDSICPIENEFWVLAARNTNVEWARKLFDDEFKALVDGHNASVFVHTMTFTAAPCQTDNGRTVCPHQNISTTALPSTIDLVATTCALYPCMKNFFGEVRGGTFYEKLVSTMPTKITELPHNGMSPIRGMNYIAVKSPCKAGRSIFDISSARNSPNSEPPRQGYTVLPMDGKNISVPDDCIYYAPFQYIRGLEGFLDSSFVGLCMSLENYGKVSCEFSWWLEALYRSQNATVVSITDSINGMADAMTNQIRVGNGFSQGIATRGVVSGKSFMPRVCTAFQWGWLMYPAALWAVTTVLLGVIIAGVGDAGEADMGPGDEWDRLPVWKSSILPVLYYGGVSKAEDVETEYKSVRQLEHVGDRRYEALRPLMELGEMQEDAKKRVVRFGKDTSGWRFL